MQQNVRDFIVNCGGKASPHLCYLISNFPYWDSDELLAAKLTLSFSANLKVDHIHSIVKTHQYEEIEQIKDRKNYQSAGQILKYHFSERKISQIISNLTAQEYHIYLMLLEEVYQYSLMISEYRVVDKSLHRHIKNLREIVENLHLILEAGLEPDEEFSVQKALYPYVHNYFISPEFQLAVPLTYGDFKKAALEFSNCLGSVMTKKRVAERDFMLVLIKKGNKLYAVMDILPSGDIQNIATFFNRSLKLEEMDKINQGWENKIKPKLIKNSVVFQGGSSS